MIDELYHNEWVSLNKIVDPERGIKGYVFSHETRCQGFIVSILPYRLRIPARGLRPIREYLLKSEITPCWVIDEPVLSTVTGGYEGKSFEEDAVREILEETGYEIKVEELISLGTSYASKSSDTMYALFTVDLTDKIQGEALGDGTRLESEAKTYWVTEEKILECRDPQASVLFLRLQKHLKAL